MSCTLCPRHCAVDRSQTPGFCRAPAHIEVATICRHTGEEPPLVGARGICNIFFAHCNLQCRFCQNRAISQAVIDPSLIRYNTLDAVVERIAEVLTDTENIIGFVSPSHYADCIPPIVSALHDRGLFPTVVYNSGGYDDVATLRALADYIDVYLPDYKYSDATLAAQLSHAADYPQRAAEALSEMYRQKGSSLHVDDRGMAFGGIIVRHLVLPGAIDNTLRCLDWLAKNLSMRIHVSLMAQYYPPDEWLKEDDCPADSPLRRTLSQEEYQRVVDHFHALGFYNGWIQELAASDNYRPDFTRQNAF